LPARFSLPALEWSLSDATLAIRRENHDEHTYCNLV
jgi:hypothetical protein